MPLNLRQILAAESAANDGLAYPFLTLTLYLTLESSRRAAISHWVLIGCLCMSSPFIRVYAKDFFYMICHSNRSSMFWYRDGWNSWFVLILNFTYLCLRPELEGLLFSRLFKISHKRGFINRESYVAQYIALAMLIMGIFVTIGSDDLLAAFAAGL